MPGCYFYFVFIFFCCDLSQPESMGNCLWHYFVIPHITPHHITSHTHTHTHTHTHIHIHTSYHYFQTEVTLDGWWIAILNSALICTTQTITDKHMHMRT